MSSLRSMNDLVSPSFPIAWTNPSGSYFFHCPPPLSPPVNLDPPVAPSQTTRSSSHAWRLQRHPPKKRAIAFPLPERQELLSVYWLPRFSLFATSFISCVGTGR